MLHPLLAPYLLAWHPRLPQLVLGAPEGLAWLSLDDAPRPLTGPLPLNSLAWGSGGHLAISAEEGGFPGVRILDEQGVERLHWRPALGRVDALVFSEDGGRLVALGEGAAALSLETGETLWRRRRVDEALRTRVEGLRHGARTARSLAMPVSAAWCGERVLLIYEQAYELLHARDGALLEEGPHRSEAFLGWREGALAREDFSLDDPFARSHCYSRDGRLAAAEGREHGVWVRDAQPLRCVPGHPRTLTALAWSPAGQLFTGCRDGVVRRLVGQGFEPVERLDEPTLAITWSADGAWMAFAGRRAVRVSRAPG